MTTNHDLQLQRAELIQRATGLIFEIARKPQSLKLLEGAIAALEPFVQYKAGRSRRWRSPPDEPA